MKRIIVLVSSLLLTLSLAACETNGTDRQSAVSTQLSSPGEMQSGEQMDDLSTSAPTQAGNDEQTDMDRQIRITTAQNEEIVFRLNDSPAANDFYQQLPLSISVEDYAGSEKIFYPPESLSPADTPMAQGPAGTLAYYAPWGNVAIFYGECTGASGLYELGEIVSGVEYIAKMTGEIKVEAVSAPFPSSAQREAESSPRQQTQPAGSSPGEDSGVQELEREIMQMNVQVGNTTFTATLEENAAAAALVDMMKNAAVIIQMSDYSGFEKVGALETDLPTCNSQTTTQAGDIVLYNGNQIVIFYGSNTWSYTRLGRIDDLAGWKEALGTGDVLVSFSIAD